jgi:voltage-gated hydrogen channel 1
VKGARKLMSNSFFSEWFHCFDAFVIVGSFLIDLLTHGILEEIGSLVIILRLWRFVKIVEELSAGASERMEEIEGRVTDLERENTELKIQIELLRE